MATESTINKAKKTLRHYYLKKEMIRLKLKENPIQQHKDDFYDICEVFEDYLSEYYSHYIMSLKTKENGLFESYLSIPKERLKRSLLTDLIIEWNKNN